VDHAAFTNVTGKWFSAGTVVSFFNVNSHFSLIRLLACAFGARTFGK